MQMTEFQGPAPNKLEPYLTMMLNIQAQWTVLPEKTERSDKPRAFLGCKIYHLNTVRTQPHLTAGCPHKREQDFLHSL